MANPDYKNLSPADIRALILKQEREMATRSPNDAGYNVDEGTEAVSEQELQHALANTGASPLFTPAQPSGGWNSVDWSAARGGTQKFKYDFIKDIYKQLQPGENVGAAIVGAAKFMVDRLAGVSQGDSAAYLACGVQTDRAWCMNFVNATLCLRGLKPTGSDAAISALSLGSQISFQDVKPGDIVMRGDGHHVGIVVGRTSDGRVIMANGNCGGTVKYSTVSADYGVFIRHSGELDPNRPEAKMDRTTPTLDVPQIGKKTLLELKGDPATNAAKATTVAGVAPTLQAPTGPASFG